MNLYKQALVAYLAGLTVKDGDWVKWVNEYDERVWIKSINENQYITKFEGGTKYWYLNDKKHREDGPAIECINGDKAWYLNGQLHREDGPAVEWNNGYKAWYLSGKYLTEEEFNLKQKCMEI